MLKLLLFLFLCCVNNHESARILAVFPSPSISHQVTFRPLTEELVKRGHELVVITTDPAFSKEDRPKNMTEINCHDFSYKIWRENFISRYTHANSKSLNDQIKLIYETMIKVFERQMALEEVQKIINKKVEPFDLIIVEAYMLPTLAFSHIYKVPVIQMSSFLPVYTDLRNVGAVDHPILYPTIGTQKLDNLSIFEKMAELYNYFTSFNDIETCTKVFDNAVKRIFGPDTPSVNELSNNIDMLFLNTFPIWDSNRPVPPNLQYLGGIHVKPKKELPKDLKSYLDSSKHGVIYLSFGTNVSPSALPPAKIQTLINVLSRLPYDVIWKWDKDELPGRSNNIKISKWLPQSDLLRHPKIKFFITQGGLQSTDEAIDAGVPLLGIPMLGDQWYNVAMYLRHKIGVKVELNDLNEENLKEAVDALTKDDSYRENIKKLRAIMHDQPQSPLERAVWWTEHVLRHAGARHLRARAANMRWTDYYEVELVAYTVAGLVLVLIVIGLVIRFLVKFVIGALSRKSKLKIN
ncbi:UDP-glucosyltransferase 2-like [Plodia interpunctella]|uniref:UDP-glucosyltransferase 2-like n=1 Tax=Plodia interpunctella TaxID=58824 RepID=UPI002367659F|nr:UDP-glucosyltransferase 2-like [Plodia interpunctella]